MSDLGPLADAEWEDMTSRLDHIVSNWAAVGAPEDGTIDIRITSVIRLTAYVNELRMAKAIVDKLFNDDMGYFDEELGVVDVRCDFTEAEQRYLKRLGSGS